ncbi:MAG: LptA/OstA family protein [Candidatus Margulisiibacteriota bacterium]
MSPIKTTAICAFSAIILLMLIQVGFWTLQNTGHELEPKFADARPAFELRGLMLRGWEKDSPRWQLGVRQAQSDGDDRYRLKGIHQGQLWDRQQRLLLRQLNAQSGEMHFKERRLRLMKVSVQLRSSVDMTVDELSINEKSKQVLLSGNIIIRKGTTVLRSPQGVVDDQTGQAIFGAGFILEDRQLNASGAECRMNESGEFRFTNTRLIQREQKMQAQAMTLNFNQSLLSMGGAVSFSKPDFKATAGQGTLDLTRHVLMLRGHVSVTHKTRTFSCDLVEVDLDASTFSAEGHVRSEIRI